MSKSLTFALQALLVRHEQYMLDAQRDRNELSTRIEELEQDKRHLENENAKKIAENRALLDQLEAVNETVAESEAHIKSLEATLQSAQQEVRRLDGLAARTKDLECQLMVLEQEQAVLQRTVSTTEAQERSAVQRWKKAERNLSLLQDQLEHIEKEGREERERHVEVLGRMERQRAVERELDTAAGRLKGAAAVTVKGHNGSNVVSHFVKDILQDNANLQLGIVELRDMLMNSNDEVQSLREQLLLHQPVEDAQTLRAELSQKEPKDEKPSPVVSQELHIHHHYHAPKEESRRPKKKRTSLSSSIFTPLRGTQSPRTPRARETANAILSQTSVTIPAAASNRWSMQSGGQASEFAPSSAPSSPQSMYRNGLFDRGFDVDSSRPTSPGSSIDPMSPSCQPLQSHRNRGSIASTRFFTTPQNFQPHSTIHEEHDYDDDIPDLHMQSDSQTATPTTSTPAELIEELPHTPFKPTLHRSTSHESILSISGLYIHTLKSHPSQMTSMLLRPQISSSNLSTSLNTHITARPTLVRKGHDSRLYLRDLAKSQAAADVHSLSSSSISSRHSDGKEKQKQKEKEKPSTTGWSWSKWRVSPPPPPPAQMVRKRGEEGAPTRYGFMGRPPGINQKGFVPGFGVGGNRSGKRDGDREREGDGERRVSNGMGVSVRPEVVDREALREGLEGLDV